MLTPDESGNLGPVHDVAAAMPLLKTGVLYEFHTSRPIAGQPHRLWHINTLDLRPQTPAYRGQ